MCENSQRSQPTNLLEMDWSKLTEEQLEVLADLYMRNVLGPNDPNVLEGSPADRGRRDIARGRYRIDADG